MIFRKWLHALAASTSALLFTATSAYALTPEELTMSLYLKLASSVMPNGNDLKVGRSYFIVANPGILIGKPEDLTGELAEQALISQLDMAPKKNPFYEPGLFHLSKLYDASVSEMEVPHPENEKDLLKLYNDMQAKKKTTLQSQYKDYNTRREAVAAVDAEIDDYLRAEALRLSKDIQSIELPLSYQNKRKLAAKALKDFPNIGDVAQLEDQLATVENSLPIIFKERLRQQYADYNTGGLFPKYVFFPSVNKWALGNWTKYSTSETDLSQYSKDEFKSSSGGLGGSGSFLGGFLGGSASKNKSETWKYSDVEAKDLKLEYELTRVGIYRPWLDSRIFTSKRWRIPKAGDLGCSVWSSGEPATVNERELSPFIVKSVVLSRKLKISGNWSKSIQQEYSLQESAGGHVRWGFFSVGGNKNHTVSQKDSKAKVSATTIENPDIQIIGFVVEPLGKTPNPDTTQAWTTPAPDCSK